MSESLARTSAGIELYCKAESPATYDAAGFVGRAVVANNNLKGKHGVLTQEAADGVGVPGDQGRRHQLGEMRHQQLLRRVAHRDRVIDHQRARLATSPSPRLA